MRSKLGEVFAGLLLSLGLLFYLVGHCSTIDADGTVSGFVPTQQKIAGNRSVWLLPGGDRIHSSFAPGPYYAHLWFVAYHPLLMVFIGVAAVLLLRFFCEPDRRPLFVVVNQLAITLAAGVGAEMLYFALVFRGIHWDGAMLAFMTMSVFNFLMASALSFYLLAIACKPDHSAQLADDGSREL